MNSAYTIQVYRAGHHLPVPGWRWDPGPLSFPAFDLWLVHQGQGAGATPHGDFKIRRGLCLLLRRGEQYHFRQDPNVPVEVTYCHFNILQDDGKPTPVADANLPFSTKLTDLAFFEQLLSRFILAWEAKEAQQARNWLASAIQEILNSSSQPRAERLNRWCAEIERLRIEIARNPSQWWSVDELAAEVGLSRIHFTRLFRHINRISPGQFMIECRMSRARELLRESNLTVGRIAEALGYNHTAFFCRQFRQHIGATPSVYRRES